MWVSGLAGAKTIPAGFETYGTDQGLRQTLARKEAIGSPTVAWDSPPWSSVGWFPADFLVSTR
jgi:hypothetical protein